MTQININENGLTPALQKEIESAKAIKIGEGIRSRLLKNEVNQRI